MSLKQQLFDKLFTRIIKNMKYIQYIHWYLNDNCSKLIVVE